MRTMSLRSGFQATIRVVACALCLVVVSSHPASAQPPEQQPGNGFQAAPLNPEFLKYIAEKNSGADPPITSSGRSLGHIPPPIKLPSPTEPLVSPREAMALPEKFDLRTSTPIGVTPVKNQYKCGACWAFAAMASLESHERYKSGKTVNLSEAHLNENHGFQPGVCRGGNWMMSTAYMARWGGPVTEANAPFPYFFATDEPNMGDPGSLALMERTAAASLDAAAAPGVAAAYHVQNVYFLPQAASPLTAGDITTLKQAIAGNGGVTVSLFYSDEYYTEAQHSYYCDDEDRGQNHEVAAVGWDDAYPNTSFKTPAPGSGAFILRNSWGTNWGEAGYFYLSYHDKSIKLGAQFGNAEPLTKYTRIYQYDPLGWTGSYGWQSSTTGWFANIFMASANAATIGAVGFYTPVPNSTYAVRIYSNVTPGAPRSGTQVGATKRGTIAKPGYHTIRLDPVTVTAHKPFSVVVRLTTPGFNKPIPAQSTSPIASANSCYGRSFIGDGKSWWDAGGSYSVCLKAFAVKVAHSQ